MARHVPGRIGRNDDSRAPPSVLAWIVARQDGIRAAPSLEEAKRIADQALSLPPPPGIATPETARKDTP